MMEEIQSRLNVDTLMQLHLVMEGTQRHTLLVMKWYRNNISQFQSSTMRKDHSCRHVSKERFVKWTLMCGDYSHSLNFWYRTSVSQVTLSCSPVQTLYMLSNQNYWREKWSHDVGTKRRWIFRWIVYFFFSFDEDWENLGKFLTEKNRTSLIIFLCMMRWRLWWKWWRSGWKSGEICFIIFWCIDLRSWKIMRAYDHFDTFLMSWEALFDN